MRLFVAINFPADMRERLWEATASLRDLELPVRWVKPESIHLTLKFLGDVDAGRVEPVGQAVRSAAHGTRAFRLPVGDFGAFPNLKHPRVVWVGCDGIPVLELLQDAIERRMDDIGFPIEGRPFRPHLTLGRAQRDAPARAFAHLEDHLGTLEFYEEPQISSVDVMRSHLGRDGARYEVVDRVELGA